MNSSSTIQLKFCLEIAECECDTYSLSKTVFLLHLITNFLTIKTSTEKLNQIIRYPTLVNICNNSITNISGMYMCVYICRTVIIFIK